MLTVIRLAALSAIPPSHAYRVRTSLGKSGVIDDPSYDWSARLHGRQYVIAHAPWCNDRRVRRTSLGAMRAAIGAIQDRIGECALAAKEHSEGAVARIERPQEPTFGDGTPASVDVEHMVKSDREPEG